MRAILLGALIVALLPVVAWADADETALMAQGQRALIAGDLSTAKEVFNQVLETDPHNTAAIQFLRTIRQREAGLPPTPKHDPLKELVLPKVEFKDAAFSSALDFLKQKAAEQSVTVSFVTQLPESQMQHPVTLNLSQVPFLEALKYLCQLNTATYKVERYAIVISPVQSDASPAPSASTPQ